MNRLLSFLLPLVIIVGLIASGSMFVVYEWENAIRFQFGRIKQTYAQPGLYFKIPLIQNVAKFDGRIQTLQTDQELFLTLEKKNLIVDTFVKWRITNPTLFYTTVQGNISAANLRLVQVVKDGLRSEFGLKTLQEVVAGFNTQTKQTIRQEIQDTIIRNTQTFSSAIGIEIIDIRIKRTELPNDVTENVFTRMRTERERIAREFRARGEAVYIETVANADKQRTVMLANAYRQAEIIRGEGDKEAAMIYAKAYNQDKDFYEFIRSLEAYRNSFTQKSDILLLSPTNQFFRHFAPIQHDATLSPASP